ncbi:flagellar hook assembly protein FlgD [Novosphingobium sp. Fuku2-ISO-50]|jgi:flagellar basal-body rod modification protein FlgD|uniref:flagellar hook assembly protein FlgD n=1 Tax=Novosphingobium sp. Fuku2-ISO-50 TaxID=1739114 RepID=UPI00076BEA22|nr:flagellar hook capping FlgD N-terminal domain-containing protein [Novosphingobium sp. Fuku2-ISO-50]KUR74414.1 flagellar hook capping protein [Novosphingobium sp. Fuku2-ISO-50]
MTTVSSTTAASSTSTGSSASTNAFNKLGESDFMTLLTTQLSNQDPTNPVDDTQMLAQLAQFSTLSAANQTNTDLSTISGQIATATGTTGISTTTA